MERRVGPAFSRLAALLSIFLFTMSATADFTVSYCSNQNTGSTDDFFWTWQSNGKCTDHCNGLGTYAFAVIKYTDCWCTNYIPAQQVDTSSCLVDCPGFPDEKCGDKDKDLFIYIKMAGSPSGTQGSSQPTSTAEQPTSTDVSSAAPLPSSTEAPSSTEITPAPASPSQVVTSVATSSPETVIQTVTRVAPTSTVYSPSTSASATSTPATEPSTTHKHVSTTTGEQSEQPTTSIWVVTESGAVVTRTVVVSPSSATSKNESNGSKTNTGAIAGGVVGGVLGLLAIVGVVFFALWRRRKQQREQQHLEAGGPSGITRNTSTMSKAGLLGNTAERDIQYPPRIMTNFSTRGSRHDGDSISPVTGDSRFSQPVMIDSRLDPRAVLTFHGASVSRDSLASIDDSRDYGRQLNVRNPDPEHHRD